jgi:hypothetical protein
MQNLFNFITNHEGNYCLLEKHGNRVLIDSQYSDDSYEWIFETIIEGLIKIFEEWEVLLKLEPKEIIIFKDENNFIVEGRSFLEQ